MPVVPAMEPVPPAGVPSSGPPPGAAGVPADPGVEGAPGFAAHHGPAVRRTDAPDVDGPHWLTVLYDAGCPLCRWVRGWLERQELLVPLVLVPLGSAQAWQLFPHLDHERTAREVTVVSERGEVWTADGAWIMCLWATRRFRGLAHQLSAPGWRARARDVALGVAAMTSRTPRPEACARPVG